MDAVLPLLGKNSQNFAYTNAHYIFTDIWVMILSYPSRAYVL